MEDMKNKVEAILFAAGKKVSLSDLDSLLEVKTPGLIKSTIEDLRKEYKNRNSPLMFIDESDGWKLAVKESYLEIVHKINPYTELSKAVMETLAVIAWKQPITQAQVVAIRSNKSYEHIKELADLGFLIKEKFGRSFVLKLTQKFMDYFDLPDAKAAKKLFENFKDEDVQKKLDLVAEKEGVLDKEHLGPFEVYNSDKPEEKDSDEEAEALGDLNVYESTPEISESEEQNDSSEQEKDSSEVVDEDFEKNKAKRLAEELLAEDKPEPEEDEEPSREINPALQEVLDESSDDDDTSKKSEDAEYKDAESNVSEFNETESDSEDVDSDKETQTSNKQTDSDSEPITK